MVDNTNFSEEYVNKYIELKKGFAKKYRVFPPDVSFNTNAVVSLFDVNFDGIISRKEFQSVSRETFDKYLKDLSKYNTRRNNVPCEITYEKIQSSFDDDIVKGDELEGWVRDFGLKNKNIPENKHLKDICQISRSEREKELLYYGIKKSELNDLESYEKDNLLRHIRIQRVIHDVDSKKVDWHMGTYYQGGNSLCAFLAFIDSLDSAQLRSLYSRKFDSSGKVYYEVTFPMDKNTGQKIIITNEELNSGEVTYTEPSGEVNTLSDLPCGDKDATLLSMAFIKRFGSHYYSNGAFPDEIRNIFKTPQEKNYNDIIYLTPEDLANLPKNATVSILCNYDLEQKNLDDKNFTLSDNLTGEIDRSYVYLSNGTKILRAHSFSVRGYDPVKKELIVSGNEYVNTSELRIPASMAKYLHVALQQD